MTPEQLAESSRLAALRKYHILDTDEEQEFNDIVELARLICQTPVGLVSLVDVNRQWFKAKTGTDLCETPIEQAVCAHAIKEPELLVIPDLTADERTARNTLITEDPKIRFYAGAVLRTAEGEALGTVCVLDTVPHLEGLSASQAAGLKALARQAMHALELRKITFAQSDALGLEQANNVGVRVLLRDSEASVRLQRALVVVGDALRDANSRNEAITIGMQALANNLNLSRAGFATIDDEAKQFVVVHDWASAGTASTIGRYNLVETLPIVERLRNGEIVTSSDYRSDPSLVGDRALFGAIGAVASVNVPLIQDDQFRGLVFAHCATPRLWTALEVDFVRAVADRTFAAIVKIDAEAQQRVLNEELSHRMKNMFSMVQAIAAQTLKDVTEKESVRLFNKRILALSTAHGLLLERNWASARVRQVLEATLGPQHDMARFALSGPNLLLEAKTALSLSLLMHELATNAVKYGSLSVPLGRVSVDWSIERTSEGSQFVLTWAESGGPVVVEPARSGFGSRIIAMGLGASSKGVVDYRAAGLQAQFRAPLSVVID